MAGLTRIAGGVCRNVWGVRLASWSRSASVRSVSLSAVRWNQEKVTHTGQVSQTSHRSSVLKVVFLILQHWERNDYRNVRFVDKEKQVSNNTRFLRKGWRK